MSVDVIFEDIAFEWVSRLLGAMVLKGRLLEVGSRCRGLCMLQEWARASNDCALRRDPRRVMPGIQGKHRRTKGRGISALQTMWRDKANGDDAEQRRVERRGHTLTYVAGGRPAYISTAYRVRNGGLLVRRLLVIAWLTFPSSYRPSTSL